MTTAIDIADAVVAELNGRTFSQPFTAQRAYLPVFDLKDMADLHVTVVPRGVEIVAAGRGQSQTDFTVDVAVQHKPADLANATLDGLMSLVNEIAGFFFGRRLSGDMSRAVWVKTANVPIYLPKHLEELRQFTSVLSLTFRVIE